MEFTHASAHELCSNLQSVKSSAIFSKVSTMAVVHSLSSTMHNTCLPPQGEIGRLGISHKLHMTAGQNLGGAKFNGSSSGSFQCQKLQNRGVNCRWQVVRCEGGGGSRGVEDLLPTKEEIIAAAREKGIVMELKTTGLLFGVAAMDLEGTVLGNADGFIKPWIDCNILHLDSIRLTKASATRSGRSIFGAGVYMGALMVRHGIDSACDRGELMAINDGDEYHRKLVRYYSRLGWKSVYEVKGDSWRDYIHMLVWGGVGTRMEADLRELLGKWATTLTVDSKTTLVSKSC